MTFAAAFIALYVAHHIGDYWVQTDHQAARKGDPHRTGRGRLACLSHVWTYVLTQAIFLSLVMLVTGVRLSLVGIHVALAVSGVTHYVADRRWPLEWLARVTGRMGFYRLGTPRPLKLVARSTTENDRTDWVPLDNPTLGTGGWALDQSFHLLFSVFVPALILA